MQHNEVVVLMGMKLLECGRTLDGAMPQIRMLLPPRGNYNRCLRGDSAARPDQLSSSVALRLKRIVPNNDGTPLVA